MNKNAQNYYFLLFLLFIIHFYSNYDLIAFIFIFE